MPSINMIAGRRADKILLEKRVRALFLCVMCEIAIGLGILSFMTARIIGASLSIERLDVELRKIQPAVKQIDFYQARILELRPKLDLLADSRESTLLWANILRDFSKSVSGATWLNSVSTSTVSTPQTDPKKPPKQNVVIALQGVSQDQELVGETMLRLGQFPEFDRVDLNFTKKSGNSQSDTVDFELTASLKPKEPATGEGSSNDKN